MTGPLRREDLFPANLPALHRILTPDEFHQAQTMSPEALATPGIFPLLPPIPKAKPPAPPDPQQETQNIVDRLTPMARDLARYGLLKAHHVAQALQYPFQHPLDFALGIARAPAESFLTAVAAPGVGESRPNPNLSKGGNSANAPIGGTYDAEHGGVTDQQRTQAGIQSVANAVAPSLGPLLGGAAAGASYSPDDPVAGAVAGAIFGKTLDLGVRGIKAGVTAARGTPEATPTEPPVPGMERTAEEAGLAAQAQADRNASRAAVQADREASRAAVRDDLAASRRAVGGHVQALKDAWDSMFQHAPEMDQAKGIIRATTGAMAAQYEQAAFKLDDFRRAVNGLSDEDRLNFIDAIETGAYKNPETLDNVLKGFSQTPEDFDKNGPIPYDLRPDLDPAFHPLAESIRSTLDNARDAIQNLGTGKLDHFIEDYFPHVWADPDQASIVMRSIGSKGPFEGPASFLKERSIPTTKEGIEQGLKPLTTNPIDLTLLKLREMSRYLMAHQSLNELKDAGLVHYVDYANGGTVPDGYAKINDKIATVFGPRTGAVSVPEGAVQGLEYTAGQRGITSAEPVRPEDINVYGRRIMGEYWAPEPVAGVVNNYLSPGLGQTLKNWFPGPAGRGMAMTADAWRGLGNTLNQAQLGLSAFHLGMTSLDATVSRTALGLQYLADGKPGEAVTKILTSPIASLPGVVQGTVGDLSNHLFGTDFQFGLGARIRQAYLDPVNAPADMLALANAVKEAGGRVTMDSYYKNSVAEKYLDLLRQEWHAVKGGDFKTAAEKDFLAGNRAIPAFFEMATKPIMEHIVPLQKLQVFGEQAQRILATLPDDASLTERRGALQEAWDSTDNRMGQLVYDNLFWNKTFKDLAMLSTRSVGWNLGTIRELGGGLVDLAKSPVTKRLTPAAAYAISLPITVGMYSALYQYMRTGQGPQELKDYMYPQTGDTDADGNPERVQLPSYMKDLFSYSHHPFSTITHKVSPLPSAIFDMMKNQDFYGDEIRNPHDPLVLQLQQEADFIGKTMTPFGIRNAMESAQRGDNATTRAQAFVGITPAPREVVRTPAENLMHDYARERGSGGATPEMIEARQERAAILSGLRGNKGVDLEASITKAIEHGNLAGPQLARMLKTAGMTPDQALYKTMSLPQALEIFKIAQPREQAKLAEILAKKIEKAQR